MTTAPEGLSTSSRPSGGRLWRNPFRAERLGGFLPFFWYGMRTRHWLKLAASGGGITVNRLPNALGVTLMAPPSSAMHYLSEAIYGRRAARVEVMAPVFLLGHWRSGTTFLHNLMTRDPRFAGPTTFECVFPGGFLVAERALGWALSPFLPRKRPMDDVPMASDAPFEDEFALAKIGLPSPYSALAFPRNGSPPSAHLDIATLPEGERLAWESGFLWLMRRLQLAHAGKRLVLKSPPHTARISTLLKLFPDARFVHIARNPYDIYPSTLNLWKVLHSRLGLQNPGHDDDWLPEHVLSTLPCMYAAYVRDIDAIPAGRLVEIRYEDLVANPAATLSGVYAGLGLGDFEPVRRAVGAYLATLGAHQPSMRALSAAQRETIDDRWSSYFARFGYASGDCPPPAPALSPRSGP